MKKHFYLFIFAAIFYSFSAMAQHCVEFESQAMSAQFGNGINNPGDVIFTEDNIPVSVEFFEWSSGGGTFGTASVIDGSSSFGTAHAMWTSNINLVFDFSMLGFIPNRVVFDFTDSGGEENISVNGSPIYAGELMGAPMPPGIAVQFVNMGSFWRATLSGQITSLLVGGQEFALDNICARLITDPSYCVDHELLAPGMGFGSGINAQGEVIFSENDIDVSVEYFEWPAGGGTFGVANVIDGTGMTGDGQAMWTNNINMGYHFGGLEELPNWVSFDFSDLGGNENISVNGYPIFAGELTAAVMPPGFSLIITNMGTYQHAEVISQNSFITELIVGGQEFAIDNICPQQVGFYTSCVDFETLALGSMFGAGFNSPGDVIFSQNGIPVSVDDFSYVGGGGTFGIAEVTNSSGIGSGQDMREGNINLVFDFTEIGMFSEMVTFDFADYGGHENIGVNDHPVFAGELSAATLPPGFSISVVMNGYIGSCVIMGNIEKLTLGGQEFFVDNVCAYQLVSVDDPPGNSGGSSAILGQNYPNPLSGASLIPFEITEPTQVSIVVYDHTGRKVETLTDATYGIGQHVVSWDAAGLPAGIYICCMYTPLGSQTRKMSLIR